MKIDVLGFEASGSAGQERATRRERVVHIRQEDALIAARLFCSTSSPPNFHCQT